MAENINLNPRGGGLPPREPGYVLIKGYDDEWTDRTLTIIYIYHRPKKSDVLHGDIQVLTAFARALNRGELVDAASKSPNTTTQPVSVLIVTKGSHQSTHTKQEPKHMTVFAANEELWKSGYTRRCFHVYDGTPKDSIIPKGEKTSSARRSYAGWRASSNKSNRMSGVAMQKTIQAALSIDIRDILAEDETEVPDVEEWNWVSQDFIEADWEDSEVALMRPEGGYWVYPRMGPK